MSNIINSQNIQINNTVSSGRKNTATNYTEAPQSLPKYSISDVLREQDEFRHSVLQSQNLSKSDGHLNILAPIIAITGLIVLALTHKK